MSTRIYLVTNRNNDVQQLVRANSQAQAIRHVARSTFGAAVAAQESLVGLLMVLANVHWGRSELRHASFDRMLQGMPRPDLERVLAVVRSWRGG